MQKTMKLLATIATTAVLLVTVLSSAALILRPRFLRRRLRISSRLFKGDIFSHLVLWCGLFPALLCSASGFTSLSAVFVALASIPPLLLPASLKIVERRKVCVAALSFEAVGLLVYVFEMTGLAPGGAVTVFSLSVAVLYIAVFFSLFSFRLTLISRPSGRSSLSAAALLLSDAVYLVVSLLMVSLMSVIAYAESLSVGGHGIVTGTAGTLSLACLCAELVFSLIRRSCGCNFLLLGKLEKMVICAFQDCIGDRSVSTEYKNGLYRNVFERVEEYFRSDSPYLENNLSINDVSEHIFTNKVYVSRAISACSGSNFCQYVNGYRIRYAMDCFCQDPTLKVAELAFMSGFKTVASYNMAFRRIVGEIPSEWMRRITFELRGGSRTASRVSAA